MSCDLSQPPAPFNDGPLPPHIVRFISEKEMAQIAAPYQLPNGDFVTFCAFTDVTKRPMVIYIDKQYYQPEILTHEYGHLRGWRHPKRIQRPA